LISLHRKIAASKMAHEYNQLTLPSNEIIINGLFLLFSSTTNIFPI
jgi:hypothetical protein